MNMDEENLASLQRPSLSSVQGWGSLVLPALAAYPRVHHTSRKRELVALVWKGSDHIRRRSPCTDHTHTRSYCYSCGDLVPFKFLIRGPAGGLAAVLTVI